MHLQNIFIYPIKSGAALPMTEAHVEPRGLRDDRRWMVVDANNRFVTGRQHPQLTQVKATPAEAGLTLAAPHMSTLMVQRPEEAAGVPVQVWKDTVSALPADREANQWMSEFLGQSVTLVYQGPDSVREVSGKGSRTGDEVSFADGYPLLALGTASLDDLNRRLESTVPMEQFRPNLVIQTESAFAEDQWPSATINGTRFDNAKPCSRCVFTTVDPATGMRSQNGEPFSTLRSYRYDRALKGVFFGVNWIARELGKVRVGDTVLTG